VWASHGARARYVVVSGAGGYLTQALDMADLIATGEATTVAGDICASSCAQFLFMAGRHKLVLTGGVVAFHGGPLTPEIIEREATDAAGRKFLADENARFRRFYAEQGISMQMLTKPPPEIQARLDRGEVVFWTWSPEHLRSFGVTNLLVE
jgi:hypothetical protein